MKDGGGWHWVDSHTPDCRHRGCVPHATQEDAQRCQWEAELVSTTERAYTSAHECCECRAGGVRNVWTNRALVPGGYMSSPVFLCDPHRAPEVLRKHTKPPVERGQS